MRACVRHTLSADACYLVKLRDVPKRENTPTYLQLWHPVLVLGLPIRRHFGGSSFGFASIISPTAREKVVAGPSDYIEVSSIVATRGLRYSPRGEGPSLKPSRK